MAELNSIKPASASAHQNHSNLIPLPPPMPQPDPAALHNQQYKIVANSVIGTLPTSAGKKRRRVSVVRMLTLRLTCVSVRNQGPNYETCAGLRAVVNVSTSHHRSRRYHNLIVIFVLCPISISSIVQHHIDV